MERMEIKGINFEVQKATVKPPTLYDSFMRLDTCYDRPSIAKQHIYEFWENWFYKMDANMANCGITSFNCMQFTYGGYFTFEGVDYYACITKAHNRLFRVAD